MRGIGQVMFQDNALSGLLMLTGIAIGKPEAALWALAGNLIGNLTAWVLRYKGKDIHDGLYGFNGTLVGIATGLWFVPGWLPLLLMAAGAALSTWITHLFLRNRLPGFTAPFIISTWLIWGIGHGCLTWLLTESSAPEAASPEPLQAFSLHFGQVMFEGGSLWTGLFFLMGIAINHLRDTLYVLWGAALPLCTVLLLGEYAGYNAGLYGYNAVLCAIALAGVSRMDFLWATAAIVLSVLLQVWGRTLGMVTLTAPFVLAVWITMAARRLYRH